MKVEEIFTRELATMHSEKIRNFVIKCFDELCPDYFWTVPCSTTGKYHPQISLGEGGLVRHVKLAIWWGFHLITALGMTSEFSDISQYLLIDEVTATLLLHDLIKNGKGLDLNGRPLESGVTGTHGVTLAKKLLDTDTPNIDSYGRIIAGIAGHMGVWTTDPAYQPNNMEDPVKRVFAQLIHLADYCASRKVDEIYAKLELEKANVT